MNEKRKSVRLSIDIPVKILYNGMTMPGMARNLSNGGIFIQTPTGTPPDKDCDLVINLPDGRGPMKVQSQVVWKRPDLELLENGEDPLEEPESSAGLKFESLDSEQKSRLNEFITRNIRENLN